MANRQGKQWTKNEDKKLKELFLKCLSYKQMGKELGRTWFACKCRLARLGLIEPFERRVEDFLIGGMEPFRVPNSDVNRINSMFEELTNMCFNDTEQEEDTSNTFSTAELNIVTDWLKTRLSRVVCKLADGEHCFVMGIELAQAKEFLETEIKVVNSMKKMPVGEREKVCKRLC